MLVSVTVAVYSLAPPVQLVLTKAVPFPPIVSSFCVNPVIVSPKLTVTPKASSAERTGSAVLSRVVG